MHVGRIRLEYSNLVIAIDILARFELLTEIRPTFMSRFKMTAVEIN